MSKIGDELSALLYFTRRAFDRLGDGKYKVLELYNLLVLRGHVCKILYL